MAEKTVSSASTTWDRASSFLLAFALSFCLSLLAVLIFEFTTTMLNVLSRLLPRRLRRRRSATTFFHLLRELRDIIYTLVLDESPKTMNLTSLDSARTIRYPPISQVNRQFRAETMPLWLATTRLAFHDPVPDLAEFLQLLEEENRAAVKLLQTELLMPTRAEAECWLVRMRLVLREQGLELREDMRVRARCWVRGGEVARWMELGRG